MQAFKEVVYHEVEYASPSILVGDIGGTNCNFGIARIVEDDAVLLFSLHVKSKDVLDFNALISDVLTYTREQYGLEIQSACFAAAGVVSPKQEMCKPTNLKITIDAREIKRHTGLQCVFIVNDFEVIGYGIDRLAPKDIVSAQVGTEYRFGNRAILGAGTGLGKSIMRWVDAQKGYIPIASEGGHADFAAQNQTDLDLINFIHTYEQYSCNISWENILSGKGIKRIYQFLGAYRKYDDHHDEHSKDDGPAPDEIFADRFRDEHCKDTFELYATLYARCAKNWALDALALGGIYIAGGIASHTVDMFKMHLFLNEFNNCGKQQKFLQSMPIRIIANYDVSLYGAIEYMRMEGKCTF